MQDTGSTVQETWHNVEELLNRWLDERKQLLVRYCHFSDDPQTAPRWMDVSRFCQILMDYMSAGHFEVFDELVAEAAVFQDGTDEVAEKLYPKIHATTELALAFNDKYADEEAWETATGDFPRDVSTLGETLTSRFDLEDKLIAVLHESHRPAANA
ncbi:MAG: sigma D regulator [Pseudomonadales bacterium]